jgi:hypothetical protein
MPRLRNDKVCDQSAESCFENAKRELMIETMKKSLGTSETYDDKGVDHCGCLPPCTSLGTITTI